MHSPGLRGGQAGVKRGTVRMFGMSYGYRMARSREGIVSVRVALENMSDTARYRREASPPCHSRPIPRGYEVWMW